MEESKLRELSYKTQHSWEEYFNTPIPWKQRIDELSDIIGTPETNIFPVKNYSRGYKTDIPTDTLALRALWSMLQFADDFFEKQPDYGQDILVASPNVNKDFEEKVKVASQVWCERKVHGNTEVYQCADELVRQVNSSLEEKGIQLAVSEWGSGKRSNNTPVLAICPKVLRLESDVGVALEGTRGRDVLLVVMHHLQPQSTHGPVSAAQSLGTVVSQNTVVVDVHFFTGAGRASPPLAGPRRHSAEIRWEGGTSKQNSLAELRTKIEETCRPSDDLVKYRADVAEIVETLPTEYQERFHPLLENKLPAHEQSVATVQKGNGSKTASSVVECEQLMSKAISAYGEDVLTKLQSKLKENGVHLKVTEWKGTRSGTNRPPLPHFNSRQNLQDDGIGANVRQVVDVLFYEGVGVYDCAQNKRAINTLTKVELDDNKISGKRPNQPDSERLC
ncbi:hypothetical protein Bbelb_327250 [Branchiostoma belcheri]|nr:hypothetical protein Bbelb_327250 [Branchiostoma belcheri]